MRRVMIFPFVEFEPHAPSCTRLDPRHQSLTPIITPAMGSSWLSGWKDDDDDGESDDSYAGQWPYHTYKSDSESELKQYKVKVKTKTSEIELMKSYLMWWNIISGIPPPPSRVVHRIFPKRALFG